LLETPRTTKALTPIEHKWAKRKPKRKGASKVVKAKVVNQSSEQVLEAVVLTKRNTSMTEPKKLGKWSAADTEKKIDDLSRRELQDLAKRHKIRANQKSKDIVQQLKLGNTNLSEHTVLQWTISDTEESEEEFEQEDRGIQPMEIDWEQGQEEAESKHSHEPLGRQEIRQNNMDKVSQGDTDWPPMFSTKPSSKEEQKIENRKKLAAEKRRLQKEDEEVERNTENAKRIKTRREREEGRIARRSRRGLDNVWQKRGQEEMESKHSHELQDGPKIGQINNGRDTEGHIDWPNVISDEIESNTIQRKEIKSKHKGFLIISNRCS
jgi:hypothetical protein